MTDIAALVQRIEQLEAEREILATMHRYGHTIGLGDDAGWMDCFEKDAVFEVVRRVVRAPDGASNFDKHPHPDVKAGAGGAPVRYEGQEGLTRFISQHPRPPQRYHKHMMIDPVITLSGKSAKVESFFVRLDAGPDGAPHLTSFGWYHDEMAMGEDGRWRFRLRIAEVDSRGADPNA